MEKKLLKIDAFFGYVTSRIHLQAINPTNVRTSYSKFNKEKKNPLFNYVKFDTDLNIMKGVLSEIKLGDAPICQILERKRKEIMQNITMLEKVGTSEFYKKSEQMYKAPDKDLVKKAKKILELEPSSGSKKIPRSEAVKMIKSSFRKLDFKWRLQSNDIVTSAVVNASKKLLELKKRERFSRNYVRRLIIHEIGTHALRSENGALQKFEIFRTGLAGYLETEEGLAAFHEYLSGIMSNSILRNYAGRVIAVDSASKGDFNYTFNKLSEHFKEKTAWKLAVRAKRGCRSTSGKGAFTRDTVYLRGFLNVKKHCEKHDIHDLYVGKVGIRDLNLLKEMPLVKPKFIPDTLYESIDRSDRTIDRHFVDKL